MMDEQLIDEVAQHGVIYNRQKYYLNGSGSGSSVGGGGPMAGSTGKYETKDDAWQTIAIKLRTDVETCKKRWKYLRERYVSQRKQGDPPVYEHLSRPYLEKMKFLDQHIQPRKSYRNVPNFLTSPHSANSSNYSEYNMDSKSNGSMKSMGHYANTAQQHHYHQHDQQHTMNALSSAAAAASVIENTSGQVKIEADQVFRDFAAAVASQQLQHISQSQMHHHQAAAVAAAMADSSQNYQEHFRDGNVAAVGAAAQSSVSTCAGGLPSSSSSMKSPLSSPLPGVNGGLHNGAGHSTSTPQQAAAHSSSSSVVAPQLPNHDVDYHNANNDDLDSSTSSNFNTKKPRVQLNSHVSANLSHISSNNNNHNSHHNATVNNSNASNAHFIDDTDDDSDDNSSNMLQPQAILHDHHQENHFNPVVASSSSTTMPQRSMSHSNNNSQQQNMFPSNADFLFQLYQQLPHQQQTSTQPQQHFNKFQAPQNPPQRSSEHLLGELVTTELLKMSKDRRKHVQKRILEILFFDD